MKVTVSFPRHEVVAMKQQQLRPRTAARIAMIRIAAIAARWGISRAEVIRRALRHRRPDLDTLREGGR